jgi:hypothetical protein
MERLALHNIVHIFAYMTMTDRMNFASVWPDIVKNITEHIDWTYCRCCGDYLILESGPCAICGNDKFTYQDIYDHYVRRRRGGN